MGDLKVINFDNPDTKDCIELAKEFLKDCENNKVKKFIVAWIDDDDFINYQATSSTGRETSVWMLEVTKSDIVSQHEFKTEPGAGYDDG